MSDGVFATVPCALSISYRMPAYMRSPESACLMILRRHIAEHDVWGYRLPKVCFFDGLTNEQIHAQCGAIRNKVVEILSEFEAATIRAKYGLTEHEVLDNVRRFAFSRDRADAIMRLSTRLRVEFDTLSEAECDVLVARVFANVKETTPITFRAMGASFGKSHVHYHHYYHMFVDRLNHLEMQAIDRLTDTFAERGLCDGEPIVASVEHLQSGQ